MTFTKFKETLNSNFPPISLNDLLKALWYDAKGNWDQSHKITQDISGADAAWIHAYLHRKEGDSGNASYWYSKAGKIFSNKSLEEEWEEIVISLLSKNDNE
jgi:hypothetical protein